jgi:hypothetical protein
MAGITATALVGLAATTAAWLSARDDRATQRALAHDERTCGRRVAVYAQAIDFLQGQKNAWDEYAVSPEFLRRVGLHFRKKIPFDDRPPQRLTTRLRMFGSRPAFEAFQAAQSLQDEIPSDAFCCVAGKDYLEPSWDSELGYLTQRPKKFFPPYRRFKAQVVRFDDIVHDEVG